MQICKTDVLDEFLNLMFQVEPNTRSTTAILMRVCFSSIVILYVNYRVLSTVRVTP